MIFLNHIASFLKSLMLSHNTWKQKQHHNLALPYHSNSFPTTFLCFLQTNNTCLLFLVILNRKVPRHGAFLNFWLHLCLSWCLVVCVVQWSKMSCSVQDVHEMSPVLHPARVSNILPDIHVGERSLLTIIWT